MRDPPFRPFALGRYRCDEHLRAGGIGDLYAAVHLPSNSRCAVWRLCPELLQDPESAEQLLQVQLRLQEVVHPNIVPVREILRRESEIYVVTDHQPGISLRRLLRRLWEIGPLSPPLAGYLVWQICQGLDYVHHLKREGRPYPLVHGALWPQNVLLTYRGDVRLTDFGSWLIPRAAYGDDEVSVRTHFSYRAPEHVGGQTLTRATDLFCVGILLFEMLTGRPLFLAATLMETVQRAEEAELGDLSGVPAALQQVLRRCMAREPRDRYADVASFIADLSLVVVGVGDRAVRQELVRFLAAQFSTVESPRPQPAPLPGQEGDETTNISPTDLTEVLLALSRERTDPGRQPMQPRKLATTITDHVEERTHVDPLVPEPLDSPLPASELADESPTAVQDSPDVLPGFGRASQRPTTEVQPPPLFPPPAEEEPVMIMGSPIKDYTTQETTAQAPRGMMEIGEEEPTFAAGRSPAPLRPLPQAKASPEPVRRSPILDTGGSDGDEIPTLNEKPFEISRGREGPPDLSHALPPIEARSSAPRWPSGALFKQPSLRPAELARGVPTAAGREGRPARGGPPPPPHRVGPTLPPHPGPLAPTQPELPDSDLPDPDLPDSELPDQLSSLVAGDPAGLFFEQSAVSEPAGVFHANEGTPLSAFDPDAFSLSYSQSYEKFQKRARISPAHLMLGMAVLVFLVAVTMAVRRLITQSRAVEPAAIGRDARPPPADRSPPPARPEARAETVRSVGKDYSDLLGDKLAPGVLRVNSNPPKARLFVGRQLRGMTGARGVPGSVVQLKPGSKVEVAVVAIGYRIHQQQVVLPRDQGLKLDIELEKSDYPKQQPRAGILRVRCRGQDLHLRRVFINQEDTGFSCDRADFRLRPGVYKVGLYSVERNEMLVRRVRILYRKVRWLIEKSRRRAP